MPSTPDSSAADIAIVESFFEAFKALDVERALSLMAEDVVYQNVPFPADRGKAAVTRTLGMFGKFMTGFDVKMRNIAARDGVVLTERVDILSGPFVHLEIWVCGTFEVRDGRITLWRDYFDLASAATQLVTSPLRTLLGRGRRATA
jgi:limonene-1,2-epoxide hydrolase